VSIARNAVILVREQIGRAVLPPRGRVLRHVLWGRIGTEEG
jgi:hypothetical protein